MKKLYQFIISGFLIIITLFIFIFYDEIIAFFNLNDDDILLVNTIIINIIVYVGRTLLIRFLSFILKGKILYFLLTFIINIIWIGFIFTLIFVITPDFGIYIVSFLILAISLTFKDRINNIASGIMLLLSNTIEVGDLIETNGIEGIVTEITLNYTKLQNFMGLETYLPNTNVYNSSIKKFTNRGLQSSIKEHNNGMEDKGFLKYLKKLKSIISKDEKFTRYLMVVEIPFIVKPIEITNRLDIVFDKYDKILGIRPYYYVNETLKDRVSISFQILSKNAGLIVAYKNKFMKEVLYHLIPEEILLDSEYKTIEDLKKNGII